MKEMKLPPVWRDDPWVDQQYDWRQLPEEQQQAFKEHFGIVEPTRDMSFDNLSPDVVSNVFKGHLADMMRDPEVRQELATRDPKWFARNHAETVESVIHEFRKATPDFKKSRRNERALIKFLCDKHLDGREYGDSDRAALELVRAGAWSVEALQDAFQQCSAAGLLDMPEGKARQLTATERREVIAFVQAAGVIPAVERYIEISMGGLPEFTSAYQVVQWRRDHPEVANDAALFVFRHSRANVTDAEIAQFTPELLRECPLLTVALVEQFYDAWKRKEMVRELAQNLEETAPKQPTLDELSDEQIAEQLMQVRALRAVSRR